MLITVLFYILVAVTVIQIIYYLCFCPFLFHVNQKQKKQKLKPVSVIICAKNEAKNLKKFLPYIINQKYESFEIVLINDASSDNTLDVMKSFQRQHKNIKVVTIKGSDVYFGNKKQALTEGIKVAKNEYLLFTDADCKPASKYWISEIFNAFSKGKSIVLGYGKYQFKKHSLLNLLIRYETLLTAIQYFNYTKLKIPYMAVGRNLAYTKTTFLKNKGFSKHLEVKSGDDDLFIQEAATIKNVAISTASESFTISKTPTTFHQWFRQKRRHISTASFYKLHHKLLLGLFFLTKVSFYFLTIVLSFFYSWQILLFLILIYFSIQYLIIGLSAKKLNERQLLYFLPFLEIFLLLFQFTIFIANFISKPRHWK